jgi:hypothetical protein
MIREIHPTFILFSYADGFHFQGDMNSHNNNDMAAEKYMLIHEVTLNYVHVGVSCAMSTTRITEPIPPPSPCSKKNHKSTQIYYTPSGMIF